MDTVEVPISLPRSLLSAAGVREEDLDHVVRDAFAVDLYRRRRVSLGKAAEVAGVATKLEMAAVLARHDVWLDYPAEDAFADADSLTEERPLEPLPKLEGSVPSGRKDGTYA